MKKPIDLGYGISLIDLFDLGTKQRTGCYVFRDEEEVTLIETSASPSIPYLLEGLQALSIKPEQVKHIIVTHVHLDHAGGAGLLVKTCKNAKVYVHPKGYRHLADPTRLIQGAKGVYGVKFETLFDPILPIPEEKLVAMGEGDTLQISKERVLTFLDTPGHANHHVSIYDPVSKGVFSGDTVGVFYHSHWEKYGLEFYLPSTSPNQFNPTAMLEAADRFEKLGVERIYYGHYGMSGNPKEALKQLREWLPHFVEAGNQVAREMPDVSFAEKSNAVEKNLYEQISCYLEEKQLIDSNEIEEMIYLDIHVCSMGIVDYFSKIKS